MSGTPCARNETRQDPAGAGPRPSVKGMVTIRSFLPDAPPHFRLARTGVSKVLKVGPRMRGLLVMLGSGLMLLSWFMPWFDIQFWVGSTKSFDAATATKHFTVTYVAGATDIAHKYGDVALERHYDGSELAHGSSALPGIGLSPLSYEGLLILAGLGLVTWLTAKYREEGGWVKALRKFCDVSQGLGLLAIVVYAAVKAFHIRNLTNVGHAATQQMLQEIGAKTTQSAGIEYVLPTFSSGLLAIALGILVAGYGIMAGDAPEDWSTSTETGFASRPVIRALTKFTTGLILAAGILYAAISVLFGLD